jgi:hypothetical protein
MSKITKLFHDPLIDFAVLAFGWLVCVVFHVGGFGIGRWAAPHFGWEGNPDIFGLLSAIAVVWLYEHREAERKHDRLRDCLTDPLPATAATTKE